MPYTAEACLSQALEPSLLYHFYPDMQTLLIQEDEDEEPAHIDIDSHCLDKYKGPDNLAAKKSVAEMLPEESFQMDESRMSRYSRASAKNFKGSSR